MISMHMILLTVLLGCVGESGAPVPTPGAAPATPPVAAPAAPAVGPDGPDSIAVPAIASVSTEQAAIDRGKLVYAARGCGACHTFGGKLVGPDLKGLLSRRTPTWAARMILDPETMTKQDPVAKDLFRTLMVQMTKQGVTPEEIPDLLAYIQAQDK